MKHKIKRLTGLVVVIIATSLSCSTNQKNNAIQTTENKSISEIRLIDSMQHFLIESASKDTFEYEAFYSENNSYLLLYIKTGNLFSSKVKHAIALNSSSDTTVLCELFQMDKGKCTKIGNNISMFINGFSPAYFYTIVDDYNFDGFKDLKINFYQSMSVAYSYGYILTFNPNKNSLTLHPETIEIPNIKTDKANKTIISVEHSNPNATSSKYKLISHYRWINDTLKLISKHKN